MTTPQVLGERYEIGGVLGRGGMAEVHRGRDLRLGREVAVKVLRNDLARDPSSQVRFRREAQAAASLNHPAIVAVYDTGEDSITSSTGVPQAVPFIVMVGFTGTPTWNSPFGPFRIDFAHVLTKQDGDDLKAFTFNVGTQF